MSTIGKADWLEHDFRLGASNLCCAEVDRGSGPEPCFRFPSEHGPRPVPVNEAQPEDGPHCWDCFHAGRNVHTEPAPEQQPLVDVREAWAWTNDRGDRFWTADGFVELTEDEAYAKRSSHPVRVRITVEEIREAVRER